MAGYSGTPLVKKLGIKENFNLALVNAAADFASQLDLPRTVRINVKKKQPLDFALLFIKSKTHLENEFGIYAAKLKPAGMFWISWPKKASGVATDLTEDVVRAIGIKNGMVDVKVCAIDDVWSGLKFVFRLKDRPTQQSRAQNPRFL